MPFRMAESEGVAVVKVIGVGGGGGNAINTMVANRLQGVEFIAANTDRQSLNQSKADICIQLGPGITKGLGAGADPETGNMAAMESLEEIRDALKGSDMVFVTAGLGGGTGTGAAPIVAKASRELGALTVAVVTKPFSFEGKFRTRNAEEGWQELQKYADTIITVPNDRLLSIMQKNSKLSDMLAMADNVLLQAVKGITDLINVPGLINADFADLRTVMREVGPAIMGSGSATGENRAVEAARKAIDNQLLEDYGIDGAKRPLPWPNLWKPRR
jgi:cell division protein FtsZ